VEPLCFCTRMNANYANGTSFYSGIKTIYVSILLLKFVHSRCFTITITFVPLNRIRHVRMHLKSDKFSYNVSIEGLLRLHSNWVKSSDLSVGSILSRTEFHQPGQFSKIITPKPLIISGRSNTHWKYEKVFYNSCI
jgi:hypothetical protein